MILALLFAAASLAVGYGAARAIGITRSREEEFFLAVALGLPLTALASFAAYHFFDAWLAIAFTLAVGCASAFYAFKTKNDSKNDSKFNPKTFFDYSFWIRFAPFVVVLALFFANGAVHYDADGNLRVTSDFFADAYYHVSFERYFAFSSAQPLQDPQYAGSPPGYSFLTDYYSAVLERGGFDFTLAFVFPAFAMIIAFYALVYFLAVRLSGGSKNAAFCAVALLFFSGSFAYGVMFEDAQKLGFGEWLQRPPNDYAAIEENGKLGNVTQFTKSYLLAQRSADFGYPVALAAFILLFEATKKENKAQPRKRGLKRKLLLAAGALAGVLPLMRETAFFAVLCVAFFLALLYIDLKRWRDAAFWREWIADWLCFAAPAVIIALPQLPIVTSAGGGAANFVSIALGWKAHSANPLKIALFWVRTLGLPLVFAAAGFFLVSRDAKKFYLAFAPLFAIVNVLQFTPDPLNNMKILNFWEIPTFALAGIAVASLASVFQRGWKLYAAVCAAALLLIVSIAPGALSLWMHHDEQLGFYSAADQEFARWANAALPQNAVLASLGGPHALDLVGRPRVLGFPAVGWVKGRSDWYTRLLALQDAFAGKSGAACKLARDYGATHAVVTASERNHEKFDAAAFESTKNSGVLRKVFERELKGQKYEVYEIRC